MAFDLTHARHDPMHCLVPGLFRSLKRGERKRLKLDVTYHYAENEQARFVGFEPLGADDMRLRKANQLDTHRRRNWTPPPNELDASARSAGQRRQSSLPGLGHLRLSHGFTLER